MSVGNTKASAITMRRAKLSGMRGPIRNKWSNGGGQKALRLRFTRWT